MENPATWGPAERIVADVLGRPAATHNGEVLVGLSTPRQITDALRAAGLLTAAPPAGADADAAVHKMRDSFLLAKDRLRETGTISHAYYEHLVGEFFDGYHQAKILLGLAGSENAVDAKDHRDGNPDHHEGNDGAGHL
jgi:hypothetical protein